MPTIKKARLADGISQEDISGECRALYEAFTAPDKVQKPKVELSHDDYINVLCALASYGEKYPAMSGNLARIANSFAGARSEGWVHQSTDGPIELRLHISQR